MAITLGAIGALIVSLIGAGISALIAIGTAVGNLIAAILIFPFEAFKSQPFLILMYYWALLFADSFLLGGATSIIFSIVGLNGWSITITGLTILLIPNAITLILFGWVFQAYHLLFLYSVVIILLFVMWLALLKMQIIRR